MQRTTAFHVTERQCQKKLQQKQLKCRATNVSTNTKLKSSQPRLVVTCCTYGHMKRYFSKV